MQNPTQEFRQSSIVFEKPGILSGKMKTLNELQLPQSWIIFAKILHIFPTYQCLQKGDRDFFISFRSWIVCKKWKKKWSLQTQDLEKSQTPFCRHC